MRIGIVSDTHGEVWSTQLAVRIFESLHIEVVIHCGDIGSPQVVSLFSQWPGHFVFGNTDDPLLLQDVITAAGQTCHDRFGELELDSCSIAFLHGDDALLLNRTIASGRWNLVCHGHTHVAAKKQQGTTLVLNPGAVDRTNAPSVAIVDLPTLDVLHFPL